MTSRWTAVPVLALALALAACGGAGAGETPRPGASPAPSPVAEPEPPATTAPADKPASDAAATDAVVTEAAVAGRPVAEWRRQGGYLAPGLRAVRPPALVVYADGRAIAEAAHELRLPPAEVEALVKALREDLAGQPATVSPRPGTPTVYDAPATVLGVDTGNGLREVYVPHLDQTPEGYDAALTSARDRLSLLADRVTAGGRPYAVARVRLSADRVSGHDTARPWPRGLPVPPHESGENTRDYAGAKARAIVRLLPAGPRHVFRTSSGEELALAWRYLLPHE
ncbi:hypothetical protein FXF51_34135 [Nonomuraea sp. PA05]|uniref:hypothetical protein n=1 Tax=Nonomuraea sp. PA05 TaxID=2604466 RepID=UPI0011D322E2|nr:hypothetical protein [Nonomuraea sp. PA05]TYB59512.1 hypothetical protein FXF51_34135 [Nonomuraea sp. PA05]